MDLPTLVAVVSSIVANGLIVGGIIVRTMERITRNESNYLHLAKTIDHLEHEIESIKDNLYARPTDNHD